MKVYSQELREHAVAAVKRGQKRLEVATTFGVSVAALDRWLRQEREKGHLHLAARGRPALRVPMEQRAALEAQLQAAPDATLEEHRRAWQAATGADVSTSTLWRVFTSLGYSRKKRA